MSAWPNQTDMNTDRCTRRVCRTQTPIPGLCQVAAAVVHTTTYDRTANLSECQLKQIACTPPHNRTALVSWWVPTFYPWSYHCQCHSTDPDRNMSASAINCQTSTSLCGMQRPYNTYIHTHIPTCSFVVHAYSTRQTIYPFGFTHNARNKSAGQLCASNAATTGGSALVRLYKHDHICIQTILTIKHKCVPCIQRQPGRYSIWFCVCVVWRPRGVRACIRRSRSMSMRILVADKLWGGM